MAYMLPEEIINRLVLEIKRFLLTDALLLSKADDSQLMVRIKEIIDRKIGNYSITPRERERIARLAFSSLRGFGLLDEIMEDDSITEVMINGPGKHFCGKGRQDLQSKPQIRKQPPFGGYYTANCRKSGKGS